MDHPHPSTHLHPARPLAVRESIPKPGHLGSWWRTPCTGNLVRTVRERVLEGSLQEFRPDWAKEEGCSWGGSVDMSSVSVTENPVSSQAEVLAGTSGGPVTREGPSPETKCTSAGCSLQGTGRSDRKEKSTTAAGDKESSETGRARAGAYPQGLPSFTFGSFGARSCLMVKFPNSKLELLL